MQSDSLLLPVTALMRPIPRLTPEASVSAAASALRESGAPYAAICDGLVFLGAVTEASLLDALALGVDTFDPATQAMVEPPTIHSHATGAEALRAFATHNGSGLVVVDGYDRALGLILPSDLWPKRVRPPRPERIGGMATPFGVYLTTGSIGAGAGALALVATGAAMFTLLTLAHLAGYYVGGLLAPGLGRNLAPFVADGFTLLLFFAGMRFIPLSGIHAAEHKVVHCIERGEELTRENVRRMPRVHPRCGTNLAVGAMLFFGLATTRLIGDEHLRLFVALIATFALWRPLGSLVQYWVTTKEPSDRHIDMGIRSGNELLRRFAADQSESAGIFKRLWSSGIFHVMAGATLVNLVVIGIAWAFNLDLPL